MTEGRVLSVTLEAPRSTDPLAVKERESIDYSIKITTKMAEEGAPRRVRMYVDGIFDLFHAGHARVMQQAKNAFPNSEVYVIIGMPADKLTYQNKGKTVMLENERMEVIRHCRYVDEVMTSAPWTLTPEFLEKHKIDFIAHDDVPYDMGAEGGAGDVFAYVKSKDMFFATQRSEGVSTSDLINRIVSDYDVYLSRNMDRGFSREQCNVSWPMWQKYRGQRILANMDPWIQGLMTGLFIGLLLMVVVMKLGL